MNPAQDMAMYERGSGETDSKSNENEATLVVNYLDELLAANVPPSEIAIISPYNAQVSLLASLLQKDHPEIEIGSIDGFQGREKEVVIISLVRSNPEVRTAFNPIVPVLY
jgi:DNA polymerase alpha-associated DNA helicase A